MRVVKDCRICSKFAKTVSRLKVTLPKVSLFNEVVTLDLKEFGSKYVLLMMDSFNRFIQGKLIPNKNMNTIIDAENVTWCLNVRFPSVWFFGYNSGEFAFTIKKVPYPWNP